MSTELGEGHLSSSLVTITVHEVMYSEKATVAASLISLMVRKSVVGELVLEPCGFPSPQWPAPAVVPTTATSFGFLFRAAQKGSLARPQGAGRLRRTLAVRRREARD